MTLKNISRLESVVNEKVYHLLAEMDSPINECRQALVQFDNFLQQIEENARKAAEPPVEPPAVQENVVEDATVVQE